MDELKIGGRVGDAFFAKTFSEDSLGRGIAGSGGSRPVCFSCQFLSELSDDDSADGAACSPPDPLRFAM